MKWFSRLWLAAALIASPFFLTSAARAQSAAPTSGKQAYAVISEFARDVSVVVYRPVTGSLLDTNVHRDLKVANGALDQVALLSARSAIASADPGASVWLIAPTPADIFDARQTPTEGSLLPIPPDLAAALRQQGSTRLLLFTRLRATAAIAFADDISGSGQLEGVGFYIDNTTQTVSRSTGDRTWGFLAPYAYFRGSLIDAATGRVLRTVSSTASRVYPATANGPARPWDLLSEAQKSIALRDLLMEAVPAMVDKLLASP